MTFLVSPQHRAMLVPADTPGLRGLEGARAVTDAAVVPFSVGNAQALRRAGVPIPSPIGYFYNWPHDKKLIPQGPTEKQRETSGFLTLNPRAYVLNQIGCVDASTEYLSPSGWKRIDQYCGGDVAQYNLDGTIEFVRPSEYVRLPCQEMIRIKTRYGVDQLLSPEHRVLYVTATGSLAVAPAETVFAAHKAARFGWGGRFITTFTPTNKTCLPLSDAQIRLQVAVIADGNFPSPTGRRCVVRLKKDRKKARLEHLLESAGISYSARKDSVPGFTRLTFLAPLRTKEFGPEFWQASPDQLRTISAELVHWDGCARKAGGSEFSTSSQASAEFAQYAYAACGRTASISVSQRVRRGRTETEYRVYARKDAVLLYAKGQRQGVKTETMWMEPSPDGYKYCFVVPSTFLIFRRGGCIFASGNTGKTLAALWAADFLMSEGVIDKAIVVAPLSTLERVWADALFFHFPHRTFHVLHGSAATRKRRFLEPRDFYIVNHDGLEILSEVKRDPRRRVTGAKLLRDDIDLMVIDELAVYRNANTEKHAVMRKLIAPDLWVWGLTGTPIPNAPTDAYGQCRLITPATVPQYFTSFKNQTMRQITQFKWEPRREALDIVHKAMQPAVRYTRDECFDLPGEVHSERGVDLTSTQKRHYKELVDQLFTEIRGGEILAVNEGVKLMKLVQTACGVVYDKRGGVHEIDCRPRTAVVEEIIEEAGEKVLVFVPFTAALHMVHREISKRWPAEMVYGQVSAKARNKIFADFQNQASPHVIVADAGCMAHGLTLTAASTVVWYAPTTSNDEYVQANGRITRAGQKGVANIIHVAATALERKMYQRLRDKTALQGLLLDMVSKGDAL